MCIPSVYSLKINTQKRIEEAVILSIVQICFQYLAIFMCIKWRHVVVIKEVVVINNQNTIEEVVILKIFFTENNDKKFVCSRN